MRKQNVRLVYDKYTEGLGHQVEALTRDEFPWSLKFLHPTLRRSFHSFCSFSDTGGAFRFLLWLWRSFRGFFHDVVSCREFQVHQQVAARAVDQATVALAKILDI